MGAVFPDAYTDRAGMFVFESGRDKMGRWTREERKVFKGFERAFKGPPPEITGVAIMTDTDNTGKSAIACYADLVLAKTSGED